MVLVCKGLYISLTGELLNLFIVHYQSIFVKYKKERALKHGLVSTPVLKELLP